MKTEIFVSRLGGQVLKLEPISARLLESGKVVNFSGKSEYLKVISVGLGKESGTISVRGNLGTTPESTLYFPFGILAQGIITRNETNSVGLFVEAEIEPECESIYKVPIWKEEEVPDGVITYKLSEPLKGEYEHLDFKDQGSGPWANLVHG